MFYDSWYLAKVLMDMNVQEVARRRERRRLLREAGVHKRGWLSRQGCWLLCQLGRLLVALGQQLEQYGQPGILLLEGQVNGGYGENN